MHVFSVFISMFAASLLVFPAYAAASNKCGESNPHHQISTQTALDIFHSLQDGERVGHVAERFNVSEHIVRSIKYGKRWNHVTGIPLKTKRNSAKKRHTQQRLQLRDEPQQAPSPTTSSELPPQVPQVLTPEQCADLYNQMNEKERLVVQYLAHKCQVN